MVRTIRDVLKAASKQQQEQGITKLEVLQLFLENGYGDRRAIRRTNEAITGCQLQLILDPDGEVKKNDKGEPLYTCVWWVYARHPSDISLICFYTKIYFSFCSSLFYFYSSFIFIRSYSKFFSF